MARHAKPTALKILDGNPSGRPLPVEPNYPPLSLEAPQGLQGEGLAEWVRLAPMLGSIGVATAADLSVLKDYCWAYGKAHELQAMIQCEGVIIENKNGDKQRHPAFLALTSVQRQLEAARIQLGLTPTARTRINVKPDEGKEQSPWAEEYETR